MVKVTVRGLPELLRELQRLGEAAQTRVARNMSMAGARVVARAAAMKLDRAGSRAARGREMRRWLALEDGHCAYTR
jgi:hypothetical protein